MPRQDVRFAVVEGERALSSVWVAWRNKRDVYVAIRTVATKFKTSLHGSGLFRHAFVSSAESERFQRPGSDRAIAKWPRPSEQVVGATLLLQIIIPGIELTGKILKYPLPPNLVRLDRPSESQVVYVSFIETSPGTRTAGPTMAEGQTRMLARWQTEEGGVVWIVSHVGALSERNREFIRWRHDRVRAAMETVNPAVIHDDPGGDPSELRSFLPMRPSSDGVGQIMDLNLEFLRWEFPLVPKATDADIRTRAYFLWKNRTGHDWTSAESNWLEAEAFERLRTG